ncbi:MAG: TorF family putative porin [Burkholderiaceae bacterium]
MSLKSKTALMLAAMTLSGAALAQAKAPEPDITVTGNAGLYTDYRFRGFTQTDYGLSFQGGFDVAHKSGFYFGNWNSNVLQTLYTGASLEIDLYGGYKGSITEDLGFDVGAIYYYYPKSGTNGLTKINNTEVYFGLTYAEFSAKLYYATSDYFKAAALIGAPRSTKGTTYVDLAYNKDFSGILFGAHIGFLTVEENNQFTDVNGNPLSKSVADYKVSVGTDVGNGFILTGAIVGTSKKAYFATGQIGPLEDAGKTSLVVSLSKTF